MAERAADGIPIDNARAVAEFLKRLRQVGAHEHVAALLARNPAARATGDFVSELDNLLDSLRDAGARAQVTTLAERLPGDGGFHLFRNLEQHRDRFPFGRDVAGNPAESSNWDDLE